MKKTLLLLVVLHLSLFLSAQSEELATFDTITFENPLPFYFTNDTSGQNIWQIGTPQKVFFDSAFSAPNAIVTDTDGFYPENNLSWFQLELTRFTFDDPYYWGSDDIFFEIKHKFDTDTLKDGGYISVSWDHGNTWMNIIKDYVYPEATPGWENENLYTENDTLFNGEYGFSGNSGDWITTWFAWHYIPVRVEPFDTMLVRFNFISDTIPTEKEGWMIDNIRLYAVDIGGSVEEHANSYFSLYPNPINQTSTIEFNTFNHKVELEVFNNLGQRVFYDNYYNTKSILFNRKDLKPGVYILKMKTPDWEESKKILIE